MPELLDIVRKMDEESENELIPDGFVVMLNTVAEKLFNGSKLDSSD